MLESAGTWDRTANGVRVTEDRTTAKPKRKKWIILGIVGVLLLAYGTLTAPGWMLLLSGDRVDIGDRLMFISCQGTGTPTVILEHGLGTTGADWGVVQDAVASDTRVCFSSRAGMGFSDAVGGEGLRTAQDAVDDLAALLETANVAPPYILVGHSFGGFVVRLFADQHPEGVEGMVLVDTSHEGQFRMFEERLSPETWAEISPFFGTDNPERMDLQASSAEMAAAGDLGDLPLVVIQADDQVTDGEAQGVSQAVADEVDLVNNELAPILQADLASLSVNSTLVFAEGSGHFVHVDRPEIVIEAIRSLLP